MMKPRQIVMHCPCGIAKVLAKGLCSTCYPLSARMRNTSVVIVRSAEA